MDDKLAIHCFVTGQVQGVWFRAGTQDTAKKLGLTGWVKNLTDGRVEVMAFGEKEKVLQLFDWLQQGPSRAKVDEVSYEEIIWQDHNEFIIV